MAFSLTRKLRQTLAGAFSEGSFELIVRLARENIPQQWRRWVFAFVLMGIAAGATAAWVFLQKDLVNSIFFEKNLQYLLPLAAAAVLLPLTRGAANYGQEVTLGRVGNRIIADIQRRAYTRIMGFGLDYFETVPSSRIIQNINAGADSARSVLNALVLGFGRDALTLVGLVVVMAIQSPFLLFLSLVVTPVVMYGLAKVVKRVRSVWRVQWDLSGRLIQLLQETVLGARLIKAFDLNDHMNQRMNHAVSEIERYANKATRIRASTGPAMEVIAGLSIGLVTLYCGYRTAAGTGTPGEFVSFSAALLLAYEPAKRLARLRVELEAGVVGLKLLYGVLDLPQSATEVDAGVPFELKSGAVEFRHVSFGYRKDAPVIKDLDIRIADKKKIALVGPSGAGKTTLVSLIPRFFDVQEGAVLVDGQDVRGVTPSSLRKHFAVVTQAAYMFSGTIRENLLIGRIDATEAEMIQAARDAYAHDFIVQLPDGYDTDVGENGVQLSGGQRQRIAIARAILKQAPILLLDEATSSLDTQSERIVQLALDRLMQDRTTFVIAHRLSTILDADLVLVLDRGELVEHGTHRELLARGGLYRELYANQFAESPREVAVAKESGDAAVA